MAGDQPPAMAYCGWEETLNEETQDMNAKERLQRIMRAQKSLQEVKANLEMSQALIREECQLCVQEAADADGFVADCDERIERAGSWDGAQPDAFFGKSIKWRRCDSRDFGRLVRVSLDPIADPLQQPEAKLIGIDYGPDGDIEAFQCEGSKGQAVHWKAAWVQLQDGEELRAPPNGRRFTRIHIVGVDFSTGSQPKDSSLWDVIAEKWHIRPLDLVYLVAPPKWAQWPTWSTLHDLVLRNHRFVIDPEAEAKVSETGEIAIKVLGLWVNVDWLHVDHSFRAKAAQLLAKDYHWEPTTFGEAMLANRPPAEPAKEPPEPAWEPKVWDWVLVTRPKEQEINDDPFWLADMDRFNGEVMQVKQFSESHQSAAVILADTNYAFKLDWLSPAEPPEPANSADGYRQVTSADIGEQCEFSDGSTNPDGSLVWGIFSDLTGIKFDRHKKAVRYYTEEGSYYDCRVKVEG